MRKITEIFVHCDAYRPTFMEGASTADKMAVIEEDQKARGFARFAYHYYIDRDGTLATGRPEADVGAGVRGHNSNAIHVCLAGGFGSAADDTFETNFTRDQDAALARLLSSLKVKYPGATVRGHNEVANKACPGFNVQMWLGHTNTFTPPAAVAANTREHVSESTTVQAAGLISAVSTVTPVVAAVGGLPWQNLAIICATVLLVLLASAYIAKERIKKWRQGVR